MNAEDPKPWKRLLPPIGDVEDAGPAECLQAILNHLAYARACQQEVQNARVSSIAWATQNIPGSAPVEVAMAFHSDPSTTVLMFKLGELGEHIRQCEAYVAKLQQVSREVEDVPTPRVVGTVAVPAPRPKGGELGDEWDRSDPGIG